MPKTLISYTAKVNNILYFIFLLYKYNSYIDLLHSHYIYSNIVLSNNK